MRKKKSFWRFYFIANIFANFVGSVSKMWANK